MNKLILHTRPDGGVSITVPVININEPDMTEEQSVARALARIPTTDSDVVVVERATVPTDRYFRNAWKHTAGKVEVDMPKAVEIQKEKLRLAREALLKELDIQFMKALEEGKPTAAIVAEKQRLRDITKDPRFAAAKTPEDLKAITL
jgi:DNA-binding PucR family transcriptional regulator